MRAKSSSDMDGGAILSDAAPDRCLGCEPAGMRRGADQNRTGVRGFAGLCLATRPRRRDGPWYPRLVARKLRGRTGRSVRLECLEAQVTAGRDDGGSVIDVARSLVDGK